MDFNPEKIFSGIWIIPIFGFTFVPGRRAVNATEVASFQGNSGKSDPKTESFTLWTVPFWDFAFMPWQNQIILKTKNKKKWLTPQDYVHRFR